MTCDEFKSLTSAPPEQATRAERVATYGHLKTCPECRALFYEAEQEVFASLTGPDIERLADGFEIGAQDLLDPEAAKEVARINSRPS